MTRETKDHPDQTELPDQWEAREPKDAKGKLELMDLKDQQVHLDTLVRPDLRDQLELLEHPDQPENQEHQEPQELQEKPVSEVKPACQVLPDHQETLVETEPQEFLPQMAHPDQKDHKELLDPQDWQEPQ